VNNRALNVRKLRRCREAYDSYPYLGVVYNWLVVGGTRISSPALAGIVKAAGHHYASSNLELTPIYSNLGNTKDFRDIKFGSGQVAYLST
jgi:hypothetical protein